MNDTSTSAQHEQLTALLSRDLGAPRDFTHWFSAELIRTNLLGRFMDHLREEDTAHTVVWFVKSRGFRPEILESYERAQRERSADWAPARVLRCIYDARVSDHDATNAIQRMFRHDDRRLGPTFLAMFAAADGPPMNEETPYKIAARYAAGEIPREVLVEILTHWNYLPGETMTQGLHDDLLNYTAGSFDDVDAALDDGLIDAEIHELARQARSRQAVDRDDHSAA